MVFSVFAANSGRTHWTSVHAGRGSSSDETRAVRGRCARGLQGRGRQRDLRGLQCLRCDAPRNGPMLRRAVLDQEAFNTPQAEEQAPLSPRVDASRTLKVAASPSPQLPAQSQRLARACLAPRRPLHAGSWRGGGGGGAGFSSSSSSSSSGGGGGGGSSTLAGRKITRSVWHDRLQLNPEIEHGRASA